MTNANDSGAADTTLNATTMRAIRGPSARLALVRAVRDGGPITTETDWIEWKSEVDIRDKRSRMEHIVRHILGFANRQPDRAARVAEGWAYLLLGVEPGALGGVEEIDTATLESWLRPYLGWELRWDADYVNLDGKAVLVIWVEAPGWGDPIYPLRKALDPYQDGTIFLRRLGKTERASSAEIDQLMERAARGARVLQVTIDWLSGPKVITPVETREEDTRAWVEAERRRILPPAEQLRNLDLARQSQPPRFLPAAARESREPYEYEIEVTDYLQEAARTRSRQIHRAAVRWGLGAVELAIVNNTMENYPSVEVQLSFPPTVVPYLYEDDAIPDQDIPRPPRPYGTPPLLGYDYIRPFLRPADSGYVEEPSRIIYLAPIHVRPGGRHQLETIHLIVGPEMAGKELVGEWSATSTGVSGQATGTVTVRVGDTPMSWGVRDWDAVEEAE
jgi:hypothetical protein